MVLSLSGRWQCDRWRGVLPLPVIPSADGGLLQRGSGVPEVGVLLQDGSAPSGSLANGVRGGRMKFSLWEWSPCNCCRSGRNPHQGGT